MRSNLGQHIYSTFRKRATVLVVSFLVVLALPAEVVASESVLKQANRRLSVSPSFAVTLKIVLALKQRANNNILSGMANGGSASKLGPAGMSKEAAEAQVWGVQKASTPKISALHKISKASLDDEAQRIKAFLGY